MLLSFPANSELAQERDLLQDKQPKNWIKFKNEVREIVETKVAIPKVSSVTKLGWEPEYEKKSK